MMVVSNHMHMAEIWNNQTDTVAALWDNSPTSTTGDDLI